MSNDDLIAEANRRLSEWCDIENAPSDPKMIYRLKCALASAAADVERLERENARLRQATITTLTPAQETMRQEMLGDVQSIKRVFDEMLGLPDVDPVVRQIALTVVDRGPNVTLSLKQWSVVQGLIEAGVQAGIARGRRLGQES